MTLCVEAFGDDVGGDHIINLENQGVVIDNGFETILTYPLAQRFPPMAYTTFTLRRNKVLSMKTEKTEMVMKYFGVTYKVAKQYEVILKDKQLQQIKAWYEIKKGDRAINAGSEAVLREILEKGEIFKKLLDKKR